MNQAYKAEIKSAIAKIIKQLYDLEIDVLIEQPKTSEQGDLAVPVFALAKPLRQAPKVIATAISDELALPFIEKVEVVNGYINLFFIRESFTNQVVSEVITTGGAYGNSTQSDERPVIVEYSSPNIAKPFHIGHIRTTVIGAALYRMFAKAGYNVVGINHLGDYGTQFGKLIVAIRRWGDQAVIEQNPIPELLKLYIKFHDEAQLDPSLDEQARENFTKLENNDPECLALWQWIRDVSLIEFNRVYDLLGIKFDSLAGESFYSDKMPAMLQDMEDKGLLVDEEGSKVIKLESYGMPNALITKKDGSTLYITRDLAAAKYRHDFYNFSQNIYVVGHQQELHFKQWMKIHELLGNDWVKDCKHVIFGTVSLEEGSLSTRKGRVLFLEDVLNKSIAKSKTVLHEKNPDMQNLDEASKQVGVGAVVFQELFINRKKDYEFSWDKTLNFEGETGPYIQYTCVRINSLLKAQTDFNAVIFSDVNDDVWTIIKLLASFEETNLQAIEKYDPSQLAKYTMNLASSFNKFYSNNKIYVEDEQATNNNLALSYSVYIVLKEALRILGINVPKEM